MPRDTGRNQSSSDRSVFSTHTADTSHTRLHGENGGIEEGSAEPWQSCNTVVQDDTVARRSKFLNVFAVLLLAVVVWLVWGMLSEYQSADHAVTKSTIVRTPLATELCQPCGVWYQDDWGGWLDTVFTADRTMLLEAEQTFYDKTGVQPFLWIVGEDGASIHTVEQLQQAAEDKYDELFQDGGHLLIIFREYPNGSGKYLSGCFAGADAETVMDAQACRILMDFIDTFYAKTSYTKAEMFARALGMTANAIMKRPITTLQMALLCAAALLVGVIAVSMVRHTRRIRAAQARDCAMELERMRLADEQARRDVVVPCPRCGTTACIRQGTVGQCSFCGAHIRVSRDGDARVLEPDTK